MKIGFLILHYKVYDITCQCIDSILELEHGNIDIGITVVDNNSGNGSGEKLRDKYENFDNIDVILLTESYGFSEGNNIGYDKMKSKDYDFIFVANNDIIFHQKDIIHRLISAYERKSFYVAGPDIYCAPRKAHQNPMSKNPPTAEEMQQKIASEKRKLRRLPFEVILHKVYLAVKDTALYRLYKKSSASKTELPVNDDWNTPTENVMLHGSCFIISKLFIQHAGTLFSPVTKFYHEESIFTLRCRRHNWNNVYLPELKVTHMESISSVTENYYNNRRFRYVNIINSAKIYLRYLQKND